MTKYPWHKLKNKGDVILLPHSFTEVNVRVSASSWGQRTGGKIRVHRHESGLMCRLTVEPDKEKLKRRGGYIKYPQLIELEPGESCVILYPYGKGRAVEQALRREHAKGKRFMAQYSATSAKVLRSQ